MAAKPLFDADALIEMLESATARQGEQVSKAVGDATLAALQGRELTLRNIKGALKAVSEATNAGLAKGLAGNMAGSMDAAALLDQAVAGMDQAVLKAVQANQTALATLARQGADLREKHLKKALDDLDRMEDSMFDTLKRAAEGAGAPLAGAWGQVLEKMQAGGTASGAQAAAAAEQVASVAAQMREGLRGSRAASLRAATALAEGYTAMVSGVLLGMSEALQAQGTARDRDPGGPAGAKPGGKARK